MSETKVILRALENEVRDVLEQLKKELPFKLLTMQKDPKSGYWVNDSRSKKIKDSMPPYTPQESGACNSGEPTKAWPQLASLYKLLSRLQQYMQDLNEVKKEP